MYMCSTTNEFCSSQEKYSCRPGAGSGISLSCRQWLRNIDAANALYLACLKGWDFSATGCMAVCGGASACYNYHMLSSTFILVPMNQEVRHTDCTLKQVISSFV